MARLIDHDLSNAEIAALRCAAAGMTVPETAQLLLKGDETVKTQLTRARLKLGARNTTHAAVLAITQGLIPSGPY